MTPTGSPYPFHPDAPRWLVLLLGRLVGAGDGGIGVLALKVAGVWPW